MKRFKYYFPSLGESWMLVSVLLFGMVVVGMTLGLLWSDAPQSVSYGLGMLFPIIFALFAGSRRMRLGGRAVPLNDSRLSEVSMPEYIVLLFISLVTIVVVVEPATAFIPMPDSVKAIFDRAFVNTTTVDLVISTCILAPLFEELVCRGLILRGIAACGGSPRRAILWSAFFFALVHLNPWQSIPAFVLGVFFGWVYWRTGSLWTTILLHAVNNGISVVITRTFPDMTMDTGLMDILPTQLYIVIYIASSALLFASVSLLNRKLPKSCTKSSTR